ncbi:hypothetical protein ACHHV8_13645 [Paenibacillus sp. TAB 01]|uniref:hypothetical protein n=1 Tax=Paenibacillus sp. TAB 01 TaxID=3368988 RepID=UPI0037531FF9
MESNKNEPLTVKIIRDASDSLASSKSVTWAISRLEQALQEQGGNLTEDLDAEVKAGVLVVILAGTDSQAAQRLAQNEESKLPAGPESFLIQSGADGLHVIGTDVRGLIYALLELAYRVQHGTSAAEALAFSEAYTGEPANEIRAISRSFCSEIEDKPWFYDKTFWDQYLTELATHRFNRLHLTLGITYDYGHDPRVQDNYFGFSYPYFVTVPGYDVRVKELEEGEQERNLEMLRYISREAKLRGIHFQLGLWNHAYTMLDSPDQLQTIEGIDETNHAVYCRDALGTLLTACPDIDGVTIRTHYEGGIPEPSHVFWSEVMKGLTACGRTVEIDMHPKGVDAQMLEVALGTGMPVIVSPKFWAEHMGLPYHQAAIRTRELPVATTERAELMGVTNTYRRFTRYGYADYLNENRQTGILHRIWPGTQRVLLWGDPAMAAGYGRRGSFSGSQGVELCEPMSFKARKTSGSPGGRELYRDEALQLDGQTWKKYLYTYRVWGRLMYNPEAQADEWQRYLRGQFKDAASECEQALAHASRILLLLTTAHLPSASNNYFWPEMYNNLAIVKTEQPSEVDFDTPEPHTFGAVSPLDTAMFYGINEFADACTQDKLQGKYTPLDTAQWLESLADAADKHLAAAKTKVEDPSDATFRRWAVDIAVQAGLGHFFARKFRAGVSYALFERNGDSGLLEEALASYRSALTAWEHIIEATKDVYGDDITFGYKPFMRGHWSDRLAGIQADINALEQIYRNVVPGEAGHKETASAAAVLSGEVTRRPAIRHEAPASFRRGEPICLELSLLGEQAGTVTGATLLYRHANQAEAYEAKEMTAAHETYTASIPGSYTDSPFPLIYMFKLRNDQGDVWLAPGFEADLSNQPYFAVRERQD